MSAVKCQPWKKELEINDGIRLLLLLLLVVFLFKSIPSNKCSNTSWIRMSVRNSWLPLVNAYRRSQLSKVPSFSWNTSNWSSKLWQSNLDSCLSWNDHQWKSTVWLRVLSYVLQQVACPTVMLTLPCYMSKPPDDTKPIFLRQKSTNTGKHRTIQKQT